MISENSSKAKIKAGNLCYGKEPSQFFKKITQSRKQISLKKTLIS